MKTNETQAAPIVQQESMASYCKRKRVNHLSLCDYFVKENMADTESVARLLHTYCVNSCQRIRWGVIYNASMDCGIFVLVQFGALAYGIHYMRTSELFLGKRCMDIYMSDYVTEKEKKEMLKDCYWIAFYPKKYQDTPQGLRERIRKNEAIINDREFQSHFKRGKYKTEPKVGF